MYAWRKMTPSERRATLTTRQQNSHPWHSIPTIDSGPATYLLTATC